MGAGAFVGRVGGLAVALGIGAAIIAAPVAVADSSDSSGSQTSSASTPGKSASKNTAESSSGAATAATSDTSHSSVAAEQSDRTTDGPDDAEKSHTAADPDSTSQEAPDAEGPGTHREVEDTGADTETQDDAPTVAADRGSATSAVSTAEHVKTPSPETVTTVVSSPSGETSSATADHAPVGLQTLAMLTASAAVRPEEASGDQEGATVNPGPTAVTPTVPAQVVAIPQNPPLEWLQHIPIIGPLLITPIVGIIHQIPIVGDLLHPLIGYPVRFGQAVGTPVSRDVKVISFDGTPIYVHFMPAAGLQAGQTAPTIFNGPGLIATGATNLDGTFLDGVLADTVAYTGIGTLRQAGYNVVTWDPRGEWNSGGQLEMNSPDYEGRDMSAIISWLATQPEARLDSAGDPRMGMVGVSYGGGIQLVTASIDHRVDAIVPAITYNSLTSSLYKASAFKSSWASLLAAGLFAAGNRINARIVPSAIYGALTGTMTPADTALLAARNPDISTITAPTLLIQGTVDTLFSLQEADTTAQMLMANGVPTKVLWFCGGHGVCLNNLFDPSDGELITRRTLEWLDHYVKGDVSVTTGPQFEWVDQQGGYHYSEVYPGVHGTSSITATSNTATSLTLLPYLGGSAVGILPIAFQAPYAVNLTVPARTTTTLLAGAPQLTLTYSGTGANTHIYAQVVDDVTGLVLGNIATPIPVTLDGQQHTTTVSLEPVAFSLAAGKTVTLQLVGEAALYGTLLPQLGQLTVLDMALAVPTVGSVAPVLQQVVAA